MSQISGALNAIATLCSYDIYKRYYPQASDQKLVKAGKIAAGLALVFSLALMPLLNSYESIFNGLNDVIAHIAPPITCVFLLGIFWSKASAVSAKLTLWIGSALGALVFAVNKLFPDTVIGHIPFMMMAFYLFCTCVLLQVIFTFAFPAAPRTAGARVLYWESISAPLQSPGWRGIGNYKLLAAMLLGVMAVLFWWFR
jgi:SSS family solute:Na+ symporter